MSVVNHSYSERLLSILERIKAATSRSGRRPDSVRLVAVSKTHPPEAVQALAEAGHDLFGESRVQEAKAKIPLLPARLKWHFIGHLQKNKIRQALPLFDLFHGVDSAELAIQMDRIASETGRITRILLEINVAGESSKFGLNQESAPSALDKIAGLRYVELHGLMCIPPPVKKTDDARVYFAALRELRDQLEERLGAPLPELSMGMSGDFEAAILEGATLVRVGSALFGPRLAANNQ